MSSVYDYAVQKPNGENISLEEYRGNVLLIVNTATKCGLSGQFKDLETLHQTYNEQGLRVLGFPCNQFLHQEPVTDDEMSAVCERNFGVTFPLFKKIKVNGPDTEPLFQHLKSYARGNFVKDIKWNFTKFLVDKNGHVVKRYAPKTSPKEIEKDIQQLL
ncbi:glutathione peroxidase [Salisediminibacterium halotolerans]|uniref:Glutathione peroxidase n=1 Tax=Salisediminibacterium halotolerans TaxID=517425 RepID=A0A1H9RLE2_9BACI|nr:MULTISPECIES: glutathione peroxidase [Salisediminibacterium]RLJ77843.1 glutathione peroxidase [Actinophytocola xinjiangensis]RPE82810.1 glutathione peroxidase [Salisediminibacterium halotolerans]TWG36820.1 glutathione peroxidase [Salisediminibacterium halotolerans]SER73592.1 glutathione peroxidase [Salisediminibacterium haloalkalitolerans]GEL08726.1 glutathione peroxidase [Salisediminibacterium halotolerans]